MDLKLFSTCFVLFMYLSTWSSFHVYGQNNIFTVTDYGTAADGNYDSKKDFLNAWNKACQTSGGEFSIAQGTYTLSDAYFGGPCNGQTKVSVYGYIKAYPNPTPGLDYWIIFKGVKNLSIYGNGTFDGNRASSSPGPTSLKLESVMNAFVGNIKSVNSKYFHMSIYGSQHVTINNVGITAPSTSPNTDGIHISKSSNIIITYPNIATGDDCISIEEGSSNINITGVTCGPGHGISIGSLGKYKGEENVSFINVWNSTFTNTTNGLRIKTVAPSPPSVASSITFQNIVMNNAENPIIIDQHYCPDSMCSRSPGESNVLIEGIKFIDVRGSSATSVAVNLQCSKSRQCYDIELSRLNLTYNGRPTTASCYNAFTRFSESSQIPSKCS